MIDAQIGMYPDEGVAATRPAIVPEQRPTAVYFLCRRKSSWEERQNPRVKLDVLLKRTKHQVIPEKAAAMHVFQAA